MKERGTHETSATGTGRSACEWFVRLNDPTITDQELADYQRWLHDRPDRLDEMEELRSLWTDLDEPARSLRLEDETRGSAQLHHRRLPIASLFIAITLVFGFVFAPANYATRAHDIIENAGLVLLLLCAVGRLWCNLYSTNGPPSMPVTEGPYSMTRNPLAFTTIIGAVGLGLAFGSLIVAATMGLAASAWLLVQARRQTLAMRATYGATYENYARMTPLLLPNPLLYHDGSDRHFSPSLFRRTAMDALAIPVLFPLIEALEHLQGRGILPYLIQVH